MRHELRCHAVLCSSSAVAKQIETELKESLTLALLEFKRDKISRQNARLSLANSVYDNPTIPRRKILLSTGAQNYKPPLERSKSAPKLTSIEEIVEEEDDASQRSHKKMYRDLLKRNSTNSLLDRRKTYILSKLQEINSVNVPATINNCDNDILKKRKVSFNDESESLILDDKSDIILQELVQSTLSNDLLESCERAWFNALGQKPDLIPLDSDEGSLSSGCESTTSTATSEIEQPVFSTTDQTKEGHCDDNKSEKKTDVDFKVGGTVLSRVRSFEMLSNPDVIKYCCFNNNRKSIIDQDEVSLIPVGESQSDFSSLKVYKKRSLSAPIGLQTSEGNGSEEEENGSACSDESGYEEEDLASAVSNIVLV